MRIDVKIVNGDEVARAIADILINQLAKIPNVDVVRVPAPRGAEHYVRNEAADPGGGGRRYRGPGIGGVVDGGGLVDETTAP